MCARRIASMTAVSASSGSDTVATIDAVSADTRSAARRNSRREDVALAGEVPVDARRGHARPPRRSPPCWCRGTRCGRTGASIRSAALRISTPRRQGGPGSCGRAARRVRRQVGGQHCARRSRRAADGPGRQGVWRGGRRCCRRSTGPRWTASSAVGGQARPDRRQRAVHPRVHGLDLLEQRGLVVAAQIPVLPPVQPAGPRLASAVSVSADTSRRASPADRHRRCLRPPCHQLLAEVEHRVPEQFVLAGVVAVQGCRGDPHPGRDHLHAHAVIAQRAERLRRRTRDLRFPILGPASDSVAAGARHGRYPNGLDAHILCRHAPINRRKVFTRTRITINIVHCSTCSPDGGPVLSALRRVLGYRVTIGELILVWLILATPYLIVGAIWSSTHTEHLQQYGRHRSRSVVPGVDRVLAGAAVRQCLHDLKWRNF